jgi:hypothetical protein
MPSEHPFDSKLKQQFEQFQPDVEGDWNAFEKRMNPGDVSGSRLDVPTINRWAVATAVAAGGALMWVAKPAVDALVEEETVATMTEAQLGDKDNVPAISFDDAWEAYSAAKSADDMAAESNTEVAEKVPLTDAKPVSESQAAALLTEDVMDDEVVVEAPRKDLDVEEAIAFAEERALTLEEILETLPFEASVNRACEGVEVAFELSGVERQMNFLWNFGDGHFSSEPSPTHTFNEPGTYDVTLSVRPSGEGSINTRTIQNMITVLPKPEADFAWAFPATSDGRTVEVQLKQATEDVASTSWTLDGDVTNVGAFELAVPGVYEVTFEATNEYGCFDEVKKDIHVGDMNGLLALSRFSPNGDGRYDTFMPHGLKELTEAWELVISDLDGKEVYRTSELTQPWDGTLATGAPAPARSEFIWTVRCVDAEGDTRLFTDKVMLER